MLYASAETSAEPKRRGIKGKTVSQLKSVDGDLCMLPRAAKTSSTRCLLPMSGLTRYREIIIYRQTSEYME
jgi:hypothetical protein